MTTQIESELIDAINARKAAEVRELIFQIEFVLIRVSENEEEDDDENFGALTASVDDDDVLVSFTSEEAAGNFVGAKGQELFEEGEEIEGFMVDGKTLLEYLPETFGLLINPESELTAVIDADLASKIRSDDS
ncbi:SseB family protein [Planctomycetes bacterium K23_9]|uniref:SseB protein N-terminal domain-containing protein n=1 Tax=Stieleria marina TaxID=1930275 RepID=A0A517NMK0_9BACT|nr:hypothetical protein K239x_02900 [Planctomycetes bacterium K23_9]